MDLQRKEGEADFIHLGYIPVGSIGEDPTHDHWFIGRNYPSKEKKEAHRKNKKVYILFTEVVVLFDLSFTLFDFPLSGQKVLLVEGSERFFYQRAYTRPQTNT